LIKFNSELTNKKADQNAQVQPVLHMWPLIGERDLQAWAVWWRTFSFWSKNSSTYTKCSSSCEISWFY